MPIHGKTLHLNSSAPEERVIAVLKALASTPRWRILQQLANGGQTVSELAALLQMPASTVAAQVKILEEAGIIYTALEPATHGLQKLCTPTYDNVVIEFPYIAPLPGNHVEVAMPIGAYSRFEVTPTCGLASEHTLIGYLDDPISFYEPGRIEAGLIWFRSGFLEWVFPNRLPPGGVPVGIQVSMEICSEAPLHNNQWPSDITLWINDRELGTWTSPADFGGQRGHLTPAWWGSRDSQYGLLKRWLVNEDGAFLDGYRLNARTIHELGIRDSQVITVRLGVKPDALHVGGLNLFGRPFGNYPQDLILRLEYMPRRHDQAAPLPRATQQVGQHLEQEVSNAEESNANARR